MLGFLICVLWALIYAAIVLVVVEIVAWGASAVFGVAFPARVVQLLRVIAALVFLVAVVMCLSGHSFGPMHVR